MAKTTGFKDLTVWQKAYRLTLCIYKISTEFPKEEQYCLTAQIRRCAVSIPSNIAEGYARQYSKEYRQFLSLAYSSLAELETQFLLVKDIGYLNGINTQEIESLMKEVGAMLYRMIHPIR